MKEEKPFGRLHGINIPGADNVELATEGADF
jgi:hypothetical protein